MRALLLGAVAAVLGCTSAPAETGALPRSVFLGELYPSGHLYLDALDPDAAPPAEVRYIRLQAPVTPPAPARLSEKLEGVYVPGVEGVDPNAGPKCEPKEPRAEPFAGFFGRDALDGCETERSVSRYATEAKPEQPAPVLAVDAKLDPGAPDFSVAGSPRPLTLQEARDADKLKQDVAKVTSCTTRPRFLDAARQIVVVPLAQGRALRLSRYDNPGCSGHLEQVWVVDVLADGRAARTARLTRYRGAI